MKNFLHVLLLAMIVYCWSCSGGGEDVPTPTPPPTPTPKPEEKPKVEITTTAPVLSQEGETASVTFTSSEAWTIDVAEGRAVSWCSVSPTSGSKGTNTLTIKTTANDTYDERSAKITIKAGTTTQSFAVTQKQKDAIMVTETEYAVEAIGGDLDFEVNANVDFKVAASVDWIKQNSRSRGLIAKTLSFTITENTSDEVREGVITLSSGELKQEVKVIQAPKTTPEPDPEEEKGTGAEIESGGGIEEG